MSRGITENDVWVAADALLIEGGRPTIERVRQKIGRGSPNTVSPHLDSWFKNLGGRIKDPRAFAAPAEIPDPVQQAAKHFWEMAQAQSRRDFDQRLREGMAAAVANVEAEKERAAVAEAIAFEASHRAVHLKAEVAELNAALEQERMGRAAAEGRLGDAHGQLAQMQSRLDRTQAELAETGQQARREVAAAIERSAAAERRAALEIEGERQAEKRADVLERKLEAALAEARATNSQQAEAAATWRARVATLQEESSRASEREARLLARVEGLSDALALEQRNGHAARAVADLAERTLVSLRLKSAPAKSRTAAKPPARRRVAKPEPTSR
jgi:chromosome segregation ATPase